jgi:hypothetical protein
MKEEKKTESCLGCFNETPSDANTREGEHSTGVATERGGVAASSGVREMEKRESYVKEEKEVVCVCRGGGRDRTGRSWPR